MVKFEFTKEIVDHFKSGLELGIVSFTVFVSVPYEEYVESYGEGGILEFAGNVTRYREEYVIVKGVFAGLSGTLRRIRAECNGEEVAEYTL